MIAILDYKTGNLGSIKNMLKKIGFESSITSDPKEVEKASKLILPGVGAFDKGIKTLKELDLLEVLNTQVKEKKVPILGICLGAQLMTSGSEEGSQEGLNWVAGKTVRFQLNKESGFKVPHMGWNYVDAKKESRLFQEMFFDPKFYFVHSYHMQFSQVDQVLLSCKYGYDFAAAFEYQNILGVQFHPEKSHKFGMRLLDNFVNNY